MPEEYGPCSFVLDVYAYSPSLRQIERDVTVFARSADIGVRVTSRLRTCRQQEDLYRQGKTRIPPTYSQHEFGWAFDVVPTSGYQAYGATFREAVEWLAALGLYFGAGTGLAESDHAHVAYWAPENWRRLTYARDVGAWMPVPGRRRQG